MHSLSKNDLTHHLGHSGARISGQQIEKSFSDSLIVDQIDLTIEPGEFVTFLGPSGCGKSTLLRLIAGLEQPTGGRLTVESGDSRAFSKGFVFQDAHLVPWRNAVKNVCLPLELMGSPSESAHAHQQAEAELTTVGLSDALHKFPNQLSGGMKMRVSLARALVARPALLLMDEPFSALDESTRHKLQEDLRKLWKQRGMTVLFVTHSVSEALFLSERVIVLSKRPARKVIDFKVELPEHRDHSVRVSSQFSQEMLRLYSSVPVSEAEL